MFGRSGFEIRVPREVTAPLISSTIYLVRAGYSIMARVPFRLESGNPKSKRTSHSTHCAMLTNVIMRTPSYKVPSPAASLELVRLQQVYIFNITDLRVFKFLKSFKYQKIQQQINCLWQPFQLRRSKITVKFKFSTLFRIYLWYNKTVLVR